MKKILIIGGGAAGMLAAISAAAENAQVHLYEKNERLGKKLYITGKGRCNLTNACDAQEFFESVCTNRKFLYSAFYGFSNQDVIRFFADNGCQTKTERGGRVFPLSDRSAEVIDALRRAMKRAGVQVHLQTEVRELLLEAAEEEADKKGGRPKKAGGLRLLNGTVVRGDAVIVATGGLSYPSTGSTGDGYRFAGECGHTVTERYPSLVPFNVREAVCKELQGLSLRNVALSVYEGRQCLYSGQGEMMFTHFGVTGPLVLSASALTAQKLSRTTLRLLIDLKPALSAQQLDARILREFAAGPNRQFKNVIGSLFPAKLTPVMIRLSGIAPQRPVNTITRAERENLVSQIQHFELTATGLRDYNEAVITKGGVSVREIDPATMESRLVKNLYFAGEVLDLDALTGGFNLQIAWSTGHAAGKMSSREA